MVSAKRLLLFFVALILVGIFAVRASAYSGFPTPQYPGNQYGMQASYYQGSWGAVHVYGSHSYYPNWNGYQPYGYRTYGHFYTTQDMRYGTAYYRGGW